MSNIKKILYLLALLSLLIINFSCKTEDPVSQDQTEATNETINSWILQNMQMYYLWSNQIPSTTDKSLKPADYFNSLLYKPEDRFSWIQENYTDLLDLLSGVEMEAGYNFILFWADENKQNIIGMVNYIKPNSPASKTDLKRGYIFNSINGTTLTANNYGNLVDKLSSAHTLGIIYPSPAKSIALSVTKYAEDPVLLDTVYNIAGKKIGYLIYNFFAEDDGDNTNTYIKGLNTIFAQFKTTGINELILDLRYDGGGSLTTCTELASMISNRSKNDIFGLMQFNQLYGQYLKQNLGVDYNKSYFADNIEKHDSKGNVTESVPINKLTNLNRLFVITSNGTASASEALINGLKAYMNVILVGDTTYGKNVGSTTIYEQDPVKQKTNKWGMQPIVVKFANAKNFSDYGNGFTPDVEISEYENLPLLPLGDTNELVLQAVLTQMGVVASAPASLRADRKNTFIPIYSSIDRTPVRRNLILSPIKK